MNAGSKELVGKIGVKSPVCLGQQPSIQKLVRCYRSTDEDLRWARKGFTASVVRGQSIPDIQDRIEDAGFLNIDITPLGADRVFIRSLANVDVVSIFNEASVFFAHFFTDLAPWVKKVMSFQRGAWLRLYGIPLHAWNENFFQTVVDTYVLIVVPRIEIGLIMRGFWWQLLLSRLF